MRVSRDRTNSPNSKIHYSEDFGLVFIVLKSLLGIARQWSRERFCSFVPKASESCKNFNLSKVGYSPGRV